MPSQALAFGEILVGGVVLTMGITGKGPREVIGGQATSIEPLGGSSKLTAFDTSGGGNGGTPGGGFAGAEGSFPLSAKDARKLRGTVNFEGTQVAAWIYPFLKYARLKGWKGHVTSGYRSAAEQARICSETSGPCATPGKSNHQGKRFPRGAIDVEGAEELAAILKGIPGGSLLKWAGAVDDVHFSFPHGGSY